jgi:hypothetical protein
LAEALFHNKDCAQSYLVCRHKGLVDYYQEFITVAIMWHITELNVRVKCVVDFCCNHPNSTPAGNLMMTLFWYYSPLDVEGINMADFQEV